MVFYMHTLHLSVYANDRTFFAVMKKEMKIVFPIHKYPTRLVIERVKNYKGTGYMLMITVSIINHNFFSHMYSFINFSYI